MEEKKIAAALRTALLSAPVAPSTPFVVEGQTIAFIRTPLVDDRTKMMDLADMGKMIAAAKKQAMKGRHSEDIDVDTPPIDVMLAAATVVLAVDEVGTALFDRADMDALRKTPMKSPLAKLQRACLVAVNGGDEGEE